MMRLGNSLLFALLALTFGRRVLAAEELDGLYIGGNVGRAHNSYDTKTIDSGLAGSASGAGDTLALTGRSTTRVSGAWSVNVGYFFNPYVGFEASFLHVGEFRYITVGTATNSDTIVAVASTTEVTSHGPALSLVFRAPLTPTFEADLKIGDYLGKTTLDNNTQVGSAADFIAPSKSTSSVLATIGFAYSIAGHYSLRFDYSRIQQTGNGDAGQTFNVNLATAGLSYSF